ncbi:NAD(P)/FAD-dependent oxidoreductase [Chloroflexota bacterium]
MPKRKHIIIGSGPAALSAVDRIRSLNQDDEILVISREGTLPYSPAILPYLLAGRTTESDIWLRDEEYFNNMKVTFASGKEVTKVLPAKKQVVYKDGSIDKYDNLLIASGAEPTALPIKGLSENGFLNLRTLDDYHRLDKSLENGTEVAILGAGMVAMELAMTLAERGNKVKIIGRGRPLRVYFDEQAGGYIRDIFVGHGVEITTGKSISEVKSSRDGFEVHCTDGEIFKAALLVCCLGVTPRLSLIEGSGIATNQGILVDNRMKTNMEGVYAAGDVAEAPGFFNNQPGISAILPSAIAQGKVAGANMAGEECDYEGWVSMNQLKFFGNSACSIGIAMPQDREGEVLEEKTDADRYLKRMVIKDEKLIGAMFVNVDIDPGVIRYLIEKRVDIGAHKQALFEQPGEISRWLMLENERGAAI